MKKMVFLFPFLFCLQLAWAQQESKSASTDPQLNTDQIKKVLTVGRKDIFNSGMSALLNQGDMEKFWAVYTEYEKERAQIDNEVIGLLRRLAETYEKMDDQQCVKLINDSAVLQQKGLTLRKRTFNDLSKKISGKTAARFYQIDDFISTAMRLDILDNIPLFGDQIPQ